MSKQFDKIKKKICLHEKDGCFLFCFVFYCKGGQARENRGDPRSVQVFFVYNKIVFVCCCCFFVFVFFFFFAFVFCFCFVFELFCFVLFLVCLFFVVVFVFSGGGGGLFVVVVLFCIELKISIEGVFHWSQESGCAFAICTMVEEDLNFEILRKICLRNRCSKK